MPANNIDPVYPKSARAQITTGIATANTTLDLTTGTSYEVFTAHATYDSWLEAITLKPNPANNAALSVLRLWLCSTSGAITTTNTALFFEAQIPSTTAIQTAPVWNGEIPIRKMIPAGYRVMASVGTAAGGSATWHSVAWGGDCT